MPIDPRRVAQTLQTLHERGPSRPRTPRPSPPDLRKPLRWWDAAARIHHKLVDVLLAPEPGTHDLGLLRRAQRLILRHPVAAQAAWAALVAEGRAYRQTAEGERLAAALADSEPLDALRRTLQFVTCGTLDDDPTGPLPSRYLDALLSARGIAELELALTRVHAGGSDGP